MIHMTPDAPRARVLPTATHPPPGETPLGAPLPSPYLSYLLCAAHRLDLLMAMRGRDGRTPTMPPFC